MRYIVIFKRLAGIPNVALLVRPMVRRDVKSRQLIVLLCFKYTFHKLLPQTN